MEAMTQLHPWEGVPLGEHLFLFSPLIVLVCTMLIIVACPLVLGRGSKPILTIAALGVATALFLSVWVAGSLDIGGTSGLSPNPDAGMLIADNLSIGFQIILFTFMAGVMWLWWIGSAESERNAPEFFILLLGSALGMALMVSTANMLMIVAAFELASLPSYAIVGFDKKDKRGAEASLKYMIFGAVCAAVMLYGVSLLYGLVGSLSIVDVAHHVSENLVPGGDRYVIAIALSCFMVGIAFKIAAVPLHFWCPDAFEGAKIEVTTWLSVASKAAGLLLLARLVSMFCAAIPIEREMPTMRSLAWGIGVMAAITCTVGNFCAYKQTSVKRLLAYSSIAHAGYMMMAAAVFIHPSVQGSQGGLAAILIYIVIYVFMNLGAFGVTAMLVWETGSDSIESFTGLIRRSPWLAVPMVVCLMSLVGLPPLAGFLGKWWILIALGSVEGTQGAPYWFSYKALSWYLVIVLVMNTLFSLYYYMRIVVQMTLRDDNQSVLRPSLRGLALVNACAVLLVVMFLLADPLKSHVSRFSEGIYNPTNISSGVRQQSPQDERRSNR